MSQLALEKITIDPEIQLHARYIDNHTVGAYAEAAISGARFPPVVVFDDGQNLWLADGFHRVSAYRFLGVVDIEADIRTGTRQDAMVYAAMANVTNGRPMSQAERREAGERLLKLTNWSQERIAKELAIDSKTISNWKLSLEISRDVTVTRNGTTYEMTTANIGKQIPRLPLTPDLESLIVPHPDAPGWDAIMLDDLTDFNYKRDSRISVPSDIYTPQGMDACQTPAYALDPLWRHLGDWVIWEPACGEGLLVDALHDLGYCYDQVVSSDLLTGENFFEFEPDNWDCIVTNPPFSLKFRWLERCYQLGKPFALLLPVETLGTQTAQRMFEQYGVEVIFMDKRINFKMPLKGWEAGGATFPVAWYTWGLDIGRQMTFAKITTDEAA